MCGIGVSGLLIGSREPGQGAGEDLEAETQELHSEEFDYLLVASGYFARPHVPDVPGLSGLSDRVVHSSALQGRDDVQRLLERSGSKRGKVVVMGGSMSGVETASALATHVSSMKFTPGMSPQAGEAYEVHHVCSRPFWTVPYYLPHEMPRENAQPGGVQFLPLDLVFYDLSRRPPGPVEYGFGPPSPLQMTKVNRYFRSMLGSDYQDVGEKAYSLDSGPSQTLQSSWIGIGDDYAEFVRSKSIRTTLGRVSAIHGSETGKARIEVQSADEESIFLDDVAAIVMATGFTPFSSLDFLPADVLATLEYSASDAFFPVVLDGKGSTNARVPDMGFVGFYRGPYWGVMEMQARNVAESWFRAESTPDLCSAEEVEKKAQERQKVREFRNAGSTMQFPMGDYVGLMESFARDIGVPRSPLGAGEWPGPVIPARYTCDENIPRGRDMQREAQTTMTSLQNTLSPPPGSHNLAMATATFRALHGAWAFTRTSINAEDSISGSAIFFPRYPSGQGYEKEYICEERAERSTDATARSVYRLAGEGSKTHICIWGVDLAEDPNSASQFSHGFSLASTHLEKDKLVVRATADADGRNQRYEYAFQFEGVTISSWECVVAEMNGSKTKTVYSRQKTQ